MHRLRFKVVSGIQVNRWFKPGSLPQGWWLKLHVVKNYDGKIQLTLTTIRIGCEGGLELQIVLLIRAIPLPLASILKGGCQK